MQGESSSFDGAAVAIKGTPGGQERRSPLPKSFGHDHLEFWTGPERQPQPESFVYVIQAQGDSPIKVGWAADVPKRIAELQTGNPRTLRLLHLLVGEQRLEHNLHRRLGRPSRLIGEWFDGEEVEPFLAFVADLAQRMLEAYEASAEIPRWWNFLADWRLHSGVSTDPSAKLTVRHVEPSPVSPAEQRRRQERAFLGFARSA